MGAGLGAADGVHSQLFGKCSPGRCPWSTKLLCAAAYPHAPELGDTPRLTAHPGNPLLYSTALTKATAGGRTETVQNGGVRGKGKKEKERQREGQCSLWQQDLILV